MIIRSKETHLTDYPVSIHLIRDELWCCHSNGISIYSKDLKRLRQIENKEIGDVCSVIDIYDDAVVVGNNGIFLVSNTGETHPFLSPFAIFSCGMEEKVSSNVTIQNSCYRTSK